MEQKTYGAASVAKLDGSCVEITGSIPAETWERFRPAALKKLNESTAIDGFRMGNAPESVLVSKVGETAVLEEMAGLALNDAYKDILKDQKIDAVGRTAIQLTKLAKGNPLEFKATTAVVPEVRLPDYKKLSAKAIVKSDADDEKVTDKDIDDAVLRIRKMHASHEGHDHGKMTPEEHEKAIMDNLPELTDEFVRKMGSGSDVPDFRARLGAMLAEDKRGAARDKRRLRISDAIADATKVELPDIMVESELRRIEAQFRADIERMDVKLDDYLEHAKKSMEDVRKEWRPHAEKKVKLQLILNAIAKAENIKAEPAEIEAEVKRIMENYKDADRERTAVYAETVLTNEKVFEFLEKGA
jgi:FKBP-type peptidyl-prolyl cis-trans isomerase (trigger factor)